MNVLSKPSKNICNVEVVQIIPDIMNFSVALHRRTLSSDSKGKYWSVMVIVHDSCKTFKQMSQELLNRNISK